jgi:hypothetical protein
MDVLFKNRSCLRRLLRTNNHCSYSRSNLKRKVEIGGNSMMGEFSLLTILVGKNSRKEYDASSPSYSPTVHAIVAEGSSDTSPSALLDGLHMQPLFALELPSPDRIGADKMMPCMFSK